MKITPTNQWSYSQNKEYWDNDMLPTKEDAIEAGKEEWPGESFEVGQMYDIKFTQDDCEWLDIGNDVINKLIDVLYDRVGEVSEYWENRISHGDEEDLNTRLAKTIMEWIEDKVGQPNVFLVDDVETVMEDEEDGCC